MINLKIMKKIQKTLTAILFSTMLVAMFCSCNKSGEGVQNKLIGTWTEKNSLFTEEVCFGFGPESRLKNTGSRTADRK